MVTSGFAQPLVSPNWPFTLGSMELGSVVISLATSAPGCGSEPELGALDGVAGCCVAGFVVACAALVAAGPPQPATARAAVSAMAAYA